MSTVIRAKISKKNRYWIEKERYYELLHFCRQYPVWKKKYAYADGYSRNIFSQYKSSSEGKTDSPTERCAEEREYYFKRMEMVEQAAIQTDPVIGHYIITGVSEGLSFDILNVRYHVPCCKDTYYTLYRKFFWILDKVRG